MIFFWASNEMWRKVYYRCRSYELLTVEFSKQEMVRPRLLILLLHRLIEGALELGMYGNRILCCKEKAIALESEKNHCNVLSFQPRKQDTSWWRSRCILCFWFPPLAPHLLNMYQDGCSWKCRRQPHVTAEACLKHFTMEIIGKRERRT